MHAWYAAADRHAFRDFTTSVRDDGGGEAVVCLHGFPTSSWDFEPLWPELAARFRCLAFDLIGLGRASKPRAPVPVALQADLTESVLRQRGVERVHVLAHDLGVTVAQELLARQAEGRAAVRCASVAFLNGGLFPESLRPARIQKLLASPLGPWVARLSTERTFRRNMIRIFGPDTPPSESFLKHGWELLVEGGGREALPYMIRYMKERRVHRERWVRPLVEPAVPLRLVHGCLDPISGAVAERYEQLVPAPDVVRLPDVGHYPHVERPRKVLAALFEFFPPAR